MADELTDEQWDEYESRLANYQATGSFAGGSIVGFKRYVKDGVLDEEAVLTEAGLIPRQIPFLLIELEAAGYLEKSEAAPVTAPLEVESEPEYDGEE